MKANNSKNTMFAKRVATMLVAMFMGITAWGASYTISFVESGTSSDGSSNVTSKNDIISSEASDYVNSVTANSKVYKGKSGYGIKLGAGSNKGTLTINIANSYQKYPTKITFRAAQYSTDGIDLSYNINGGTTQTITLTSGTTLDNYEVNMDGETKLTSIYIAGSGDKRVYVESIKVTYTSAPMTVTFNAEGGNCATESLTEENGGDGVELPAASPSSACEGEGWGFYGWAKSVVSPETSDAPSIVGKAGDTYYPDENNEELHAVYAKGEYTKELTTITSGAKYLIVANSTKNYVMTDEYSLNGEEGQLGSVQIDENPSGKYHASVIDSKWCYTIEDGEESGKYFIRDVKNETNANYVDIAFKNWYGKSRDTGDEWELTVSSGNWTLKNEYHPNYLGFDGTNKVFKRVEGTTFYLYKAGTINYYSNPSCCANAISLSAGTETHAAISSITPNSFATCGDDASRVVTIVATANTGYEFKSDATLTYDGAGTATLVSATDGTTPYTWTYRISQDANGSGTFDVTATAKKYTVTLDDNGGSAGSGSVELTYDGAIIAVDVPELLHSYFGGYWTSNDGGTTLGTQIIDAEGAWQSVSGYTDGDKKWVHDGDVTLYAKWTAYSYTNYRTSCVDIYTVTYDANGGTGSVPVDETEYDNGTHNTVTVLDKPNNLAKENYTFAGWNTKANGTGETYTAGQTFEISKNTTLYAKWDCARAVTVSKGTPVNGTFELSNTGALATCDGAVAVNVTDIVPATGYHFSEVTSTIGSVENTTVTFAQYTNESSTINVTFVGNKYTVTLDKDYGSAGSSNVTATYGSVMPDMGNKPSRTGYTFQGYYDDHNGNGNQYYDKDKKSVSNWNKTANTTLYAKWTPRNYTIILNNAGADSGKGGTESIAVTFDSNTNLSETPAITRPEKAGYKFCGYYTAADGEGSQIIDENGDVKANVSGYTSAIKQWQKAGSDEVNLYAFWKACHTVTWSVNGEETPEVVVHGEKVAAMPTPPTSNDCDDAKKFIGWRATAIVGTSPSAPDGIFNDIEHSPEITEDNVTFYAVFATETVGDIVLIKDINDLANGDKVYIYSEFEASETTYGAVAKAYESGNNVRATSGTVANEKLTPSTGACAYTFGKVKVSNTDYYTFNDGTYYLYSSNTSKNYLQGETDLDNNDYGLFTVEINGTTGVATIRSKGNTSRSYMQFNKNNDTGDYENALFACYQTASQTSVKLFKKNPDVYSDYVTTCASCDADATFTTALPAVSAEDCTSATVTATEGLATLGSEGCNISDYGFVLGTATDPELDGEGVTKLQVGTSNPTIGNDFSYEMTGLTKGTHYYVRAYAINKHGVAYSSTKDFWTKDVSSIAITTAPTKTNYIEGEKFDATGMVVTATMASGATEDVTSDATYSSSALTAGTSQNFAINYTLCETGKSVNQVINVYTLTVKEGDNAGNGEVSYSTGATFSVNITAAHTTVEFAVTNGSVTPNGDGSYTVTPDGNGNVTVTVNYIAASQVAVKYFINGAEQTALQQNPWQSEEFTLKTADDIEAASIDLSAYPNFVGWSTTEFPYQTTEPTIAGATAQVTAATNYYAVFTNLESVQIIPDNFNGTKANNEGEKTYDGIKYNVHEMCKQSSQIQFSSGGYLYTKDAIQYISKVEITGLDLPVYACSNNSGFVDGNAITPTGTAPYVYAFPADKQYLKITDKNGTSKVSLIKIYYAPEAVYYTTQFKTVTYDITGTDKEVKVALNKEYTIDNEEYGDAPEGGIDAYWKDANNNLYTVGDKIILTSNMTLTPVWSQVVRSSLAEGKMGTICPKQEVKYPTGASFYELTYKTIENGVPYKVFFDEIAEGASLVAGKPYLFVADGESITGVKVGDEATEGVNDYNGFHGILNPAHTILSVTPHDAANYKYYIITNNEIRLCGAGTFTIPVERAYIDMSALSAEQVAQSPGRRRVCLTNRAAETVTGVDELNASEAPVKVMIDGLLFIIRGEKMYNANGQVVK